MDDLMLTKGWSPLKATLGGPAGLAMAFAGRVSKTGVYLATSPDVGGLTRRFFVGKKPVEFRAPYDLAHESAQLWEASERLNGG